MHVARDQLQFRVRIRGAGLVDDADPRGEVEHAAVRVLAFIEDEVVVGPPRDAAGLIRHARALLARARRKDVPHERRLRIEPARQLGKSHGRVALQRVDGAVVRLQHESVHRRQQRAAHRHGLIADCALDGDGTIQILEQQFVRADEIELEILLEHARARLAERCERDGSRIDERRDVRELHGRAAVLET